MAYVVEHVGHEDPLAVLERRRLGEAKVLNRIRRAPGRIDPVRPRLKEVVLKVQLIQQHEPPSIAQIRELSEPVEIPWVEACQVVLAQPVPRAALAAARPGL